MSRIFLVRHAQANISMGDDQLSHLGATQAWMLAEYLTETQIHFDAVFSGKLACQTDTVDRMAEVYLIDAKLPPTAAMAGLDELGFDHLVREFAKLEGDAVDRKKLIESPAYIQDFQERAWAAWMRGDLKGSETWAKFQQRCQEALASIRHACGRGQTVLVVTSSGVICAMLQGILGLRDEQTIQLSAVMANTAMTSLLYDDQRLSLESFNQLPHLVSLKRRELITYR